MNTPIPIRPAAPEAGASSDFTVYSLRPCETMRFLCSILRAVS